MWGHIVAGVDIDFLGAVAVIILVGVVVNNGIVLIDYVNRLRLEGYSRHEALMRATELRFRPIMMTAITTVGGMIPLSLARRQQHRTELHEFLADIDWWPDHGDVVDANWSFRSSYTLFDDIREFAGRMFSDLRRGRRSTASGVDVRRSIGTPCGNEVDATPCPNGSHWLQPETRGHHDRARRTNSVQLSWREPRRSGQSGSHAQPRHAGR